MYSLKSNAIQFNRETFQKFHQKISVIKTNTFDDIKKNSSFWHSNSRFVLKTTKIPAFVFITDILCQTF